MIHSINIIIQVDFTACSGMLQMMIVTLMYILGSRAYEFVVTQTAGAYIASVTYSLLHGCALTGGQAQYVDLGYNTICTKMCLF